MFCPNCGANNSTDQKFCRSCGLNLEKTALSLLEQIPSAESAKLLRQERNIQKFGELAFGGFGIVVLAGVSALIYLVFVKMIWSGANVFAGILLILFLIFAFLTLVYVGLNADLKEKKEKIRNASENLLGGENVETGKLLEEKPFIPAASSVTENTTELLYAEQKTRKLE